MAAAAAAQIITRSLEPFNASSASSFSVNFATATKTPCRSAEVDDDRRRTVAGRIGDRDCRGGMSSRRGAQPSSFRAGDPVSAILKSFFEIRDAVTSSATRPGKHRKPLLSREAERQLQDASRSTSAAAVERQMKDGHDFLWTVDTSDDYGSVLESDRRRSAEREEVVNELHADSGCAWNRRRNSDETSSSYDCAMALTDAGNRSTINGSSDDNNSNSDRDFATAGEMVSVVAVGVVLSGICLATVVGNALVLVAIVSNGHLRGTTHYFIANLAVADLLLGVSVLPFSAALETIDRWVFGETFCDVWAAMDVLCCTASILSLCVISVDRYVGVTRPLQHSTIISERRAGWVIVAVWLLSVAISIAPLFGWKEPRGPDADPAACDVTKQTGYVLFSVAGSFYIPLSVILVVYYRVYREAVRQSKFLATGVKTTDLDTCGASSEVTLRIHTGRLATGGSEGSRRGSVSAAEVHGQHRPTHLRITVAGKVAKFKREKKAAKTLGIVVGVFVLCWFPFFFVLPLGRWRTHVYFYDQFISNREILFVICSKL